METISNRNMKKHKFISDTLHFKLFSFFGLTLLRFVWRNVIKHAILSALDDFVNCQYHRIFIRYTKKMIFLHQQQKVWKTMSRSMLDVYIDGAMGMIQLKCVVIVIDKCCHGMQRSYLLGIFKYFLSHIELSIRQKLLVEQTKSTTMPDFHSIPFDHFSLSKNR